MDSYSERRSIAEVLAVEVLLLATNLASTAAGNTEEGIGRYGTLGFGSCDHPKLLNNPPGRIRRAKLEKVSKTSDREQTGRSPTQCLWGSFYAKALRQ